LFNFLKFLKSNRALTYLELLMAMAILSLVLIFAARMDLFAARSERDARELARTALVAQEVVERWEAGLAPGSGTVEGYVVECFPYLSGELAGLALPYKNMEGFWVKVYPAGSREGPAVLAAYRLLGPQFPYITGISPNYQEVGQPPPEIRITAANTHFVGGTTVVKIGSLEFGPAEVRVDGPGVVVVTSTARLAGLPAGRYDLQVVTGEETVPPAGPMREAYTVGPGQVTPPPPDFEGIDRPYWEYSGNWEFKRENNTIVVIHKSENWQPAYYKKKAYCIFDYRVTLVYSGRPGKDKDYRGGLVIDPGMSDNPSLWYYVDRTDSGKVALYLKQPAGSPLLLAQTEVDFSFNTPYTLQAVAAGGRLVLKFNGQQVHSMSWDTSQPNYLGLKDEAKGVEIEYRLPSP